jgi:gliding motility-associated protein GldM
MAGYKETPRQKMIGMMYLVLTALLALNVSKEILDAFIVVNESMEVTNENFSKKLSNTYSKFESQYKSNPSKVGPFWEKAVKARQLSNELENYIDSIKFTVIMRTEGLPNLDSARNLPLNRAKKVDNYNDPTNFFMGTSDDGSSGEGKILKKKLEDYKKKMLELVEPRYRNSIKMGLETEGVYQNASREKQNWIQHNFYHTILAATVTILNKIKAEVYNAEFDVVSSIASAVSAEDFKFDKIRAKVIPESRFVFAGESYKAEIIVAAYESKGKITGKYAIGADTLTAANSANANAIEGPDGLVNLTIPAGGVGLQKYAGFLSVLDPNGQKQDYGFTAEYVVAKRAVSISPSQMLVFYRGVPNPLKVVVPGGGTDTKVDIAPVGTVTKTDSNYVVNIPAQLTGGPGKVVVTVSATYGGDRVVLGSETFRLKSIPEPKLYIGMVKETFVNKSILSSNPGIYAIRPDGFDLQATYSVLSYTFNTTGPDNNAVSLKGKGNLLTPDMVSQIKKARKGQIILITEIKVKAPDGIRDLMGVITYMIN